MARFVIDPATRDSLLFLVGLVLIVYEAIVRGVERPFQLSLYALMVGLPAFTAALRSSGPDDKPPPPRPPAG